MRIPERASGILLHPSSLPGPYGIGSLGKAAYEFVDFLRATKQSLWQVLPLGPTGFGDSPYSSFCSVAGNPLLVDLQLLVEHGDLLTEDLTGRDLSGSGFEEGNFEDVAEIDFGPLIQWKTAVLQTAAERFLASASKARRQQFDSFCSKHQKWLDPFALFMSIKQHYDRQAEVEGFWGTTWNRYWDEAIATRQPDELNKWTQNTTRERELHKVAQFYFFEQWGELKKYANENGISIIGDMPIFVALDSVDVWNAPHLFQLDHQGRELSVAGVPPDFFSPTGQRWGNPQYDWSAMENDHFNWWVERFEKLWELVDVIRIDHFRGFEASWMVPAEEETAEKGEWVSVPGKALFQELKKQLGELPIIAEDLGVITAGVEALRDDAGFPGMRVLQIGFEDLSPKSPHLPENHIENSVVYTATHDNDTTVGWYNNLKPKQQEAIAEYLNEPMTAPAKQLIDLAMKSPSKWAILPAQDLLDLDSQARMNTPATIGGNWAWRLSSMSGLDAIADRLREMTLANNRG